MLVQIRVDLGRSETYLSNIKPSSMYYSPDSFSDLRSRNTESLRNDEYSSKRSCRCWPRPIFYHLFLFSYRSYTGIGTFSSIQPHLKCFFCRTTLTESKTMRVTPQLPIYITASSFSDMLRHLPKHMVLAHTELQLFTTAGRLPQTPPL